MEIGPSVKYSHGIFCHFAIKNFIRGSVIRINSVHWAYAYAAPAAKATLLIYSAFPVFYFRCLYLAGFSASATAYAFFLAYPRFACAVHIHFASTRTATHSDILQCSAEAGEFMAFEIPGMISFRMDWLDLLAVQWALKSLLQHHSQKHNSSAVSFLYIPTLTSIHDEWKNRSLD